MKILVSILVISIFLAGAVSADKSADNSLEFLYSANKVNWAVQIDGMYPKLSTNPNLDQHTFQEGSTTSESHTFYFDVSKPENIKKSFLYVFTTGYDCQLPNCETWTLRFNDNTIVNGEHVNSQGGNPRGDGDNGNRQTIRLDVTGYVVDGENKVYIRGSDWPLGTNAYFLDGIMLVTFYETTEQHEYWLYDGIEYLQPEFVYDDDFYAEELKSATYPVGAKATLYTVIGIQNSDGNESKDAIYFNNNLLGESAATYLVGTSESSRLDILKFDVTNYLDGEDTINYTYAEYFDSDLGVYRRYKDIAIFPSMFLLDVDLTDFTPPSITFNNPINNSAIPRNQTVNINITVDDPDADASLEIDGSDVTDISGSDGEWIYEWNLINASIGIHEIRASATDDSGNSGSSSIFVNVTKQAPLIRITSPSNGSILSKDNSIEINTSVDDQNTTISIEVDGEEVSNKSSFEWDPSEITDGIYTITAIATDILGQRGFDSITVNITAGEVPETPAPTETPPPTTGPPPTTPPPKTSPPVTIPPIREIDLAVNSLTLSTGLSNIEEGVDITAFVLISSDSDAQTAVAVYRGNDLIGSKSIDIKAYQSQEVEFLIRGTRLNTGSNTLRAKIVAQGERVNERDTTDNERSINIVVQQEKSIFDSLSPILYGLGAVLVILVGARLVIGFINAGEEDYLR